MSNTRRIRRPPRYARDVAQVAAQLPPRDGSPGAGEA
jgi:hypothetical protein